MPAIWFDLDGTLLSFDAPYRELLADAVESVEGECREAWLDRYDEAFERAFAACEPDPVRRAFATFGDDPERLAQALLHREIEAGRLPEDAAATLDRLGGDHALGVLTNGPPEWQRAKLRENDLAGYFDAVVASYEAGAHKPDAAPFDLAERRLSADEHVMVGDSESDVEGARAAGWTAVRYEGGAFEELPLPRPDGERPI